MIRPKNIKELFSYVREVEQRGSNFKLHAGTVWNLKQLNEEIEKHNEHNEVIKVIVHNRNPGFKEEWSYEIYAYSGFDEVQGEVGDTPTHNRGKPNKKGK